MAGWQPIYSDIERAAVEEAYLRGVRPVSLICTFAAAGELTHGREQVPAFEIPNSSARYIGDRAQKRREGKLASDLAKQPARDAMETIRRRFVSMLDHEMGNLERQAKRGSKPVDVVHMHKLARCAREVFAMPGPDEQRLPRKLGEDQVTAHPSASIRLTTASQGSSSAPQEPQTARARPARWYQQDR